MYSPLQFNLSNILECQGYVRLYFNIGVRAMNKTNLVLIWVLYCLFMTLSKRRQEINKIYTKMVINSMNKNEAN